MAKEGEQVYVVERRKLFAGRAPHGLVPVDADTLRLISDRGFFAARAPVETDPTLKQIIPYAVVVSGDDVFLYQRSRRGGEQRLFGLRSVGVGGHVNPVDASDVLAGALARELTEELVVPDGWRSRFVALLNDDETPVGRVHVGVVAVVDVGRGVVKVREEDTMSGSFVSRRELLDLHARERDSFEGWSALLLDRLDEVLAWQPPHGFSSPTPRRTRISTT